MIVHGFPCVFCGRPAEASIPDGRVCQGHAIEFWTGLLAYAKAERRQPKDEAVSVEDVLVLPVPRTKRPYTKRAAKWFTTAA